MDLSKQKPEVLQLILAVHRFLFNERHSLEELHEIVDQVNRHIHEEGETAGV